MGKITLNGEWNLKEIKGDIECKCNVPCTNFTALIENNLIKDPFISTYEKEVSWVGEKDWEFSREFEVSEDLLSHEFITLECKMLDTIATIAINDNLLTSTKNCFIEYSFDIKNYLHLGTNTIKILFKSPVKYVRNLQSKYNVPRNNNGQNGIPLIRKPAYHYGWDWGPVLVPSGIPKDIYIQHSNISEIDHVQIVQNHFEDHVELNIETELKNKTNNEWNIKVIDPNENVIFDENLITDNPRVNVRIDNPILWWTYELNKVEKQPLYKVQVNVTYEGKIVKQVEKKVGLRTIVLDRERDEFGTNFCFILNGERVFIKGANWIPADSFIERVDNKTIDFYMDAARFSNFNMIRVWGGGFYADDYFYDKCDEYGILVWQDFLFACQPYPFFLNELRENILEEVEFNVKRIMHHASLAIYSGNNEIEAMDMAWRNRRKYINWTEQFFYHILPEKIRTIDTVTPYIPGSPVGQEYQKGVNSDNVGDTHLWAVWHGLQPLNYYRKRMTRFCSEFGFESLPDLKAIEKFADKKDYSLSSKVFNSHQKCLSGNKKMKYYIASRFSLPKKFEDYIYLSQICQLECVRDATEHWRRNKGRCNGSMYWQFNDCWPVCSWASLDYYGNYKALQYGARIFNRPLSLSILSDDVKTEVYVTNDTLEDKTITLSMRLVSFDGNEIFNKESEITIKKGEVLSNIAFIKADIKEDLKGLVFEARIKEEGKEDISRTELFDIEKKLKLPKTKIKRKVEKKGDLIYITLKAKEYARFVSIYSKTNSNNFSDNYFDLMPGEERVITQLATDVIDLNNDYVITSLVDVTPFGNFSYDNWERFKVVMEPINLVQYLYNLSVPKDVKFKD